MKKAVKWLALVLAAALTMLLLTACGDEVATEEEENKLTRATETDAVITLPEGMDPEAHFATQYTETGATMVFNSISDYDTGYFTVPSGSLTIRAKATGEAEGMKSFKVAVWKKVDNGAEYVPNSTIYYYTNDKVNTYTLEGLDPSAQYRLNLSYDAYRRHIFGQLQMDGVAPIA